jgi:hypothetical protein
MNVPVEAGGQSNAILEFGFRVDIFCHLLLIYEGLALFAFFG